ncbi:putative bifunctional diguanylate cyclase/phosphodiesterase [Granulosicoccus sp. 3-233]|uniref:putative bifunctional diguanylate cyclase/phosphodiesterase n=1 Tax=Granulosicoccus sp. 3-233 TaxID=3417969 RepID=UPI003D350CD0
MITTIRKAVDDLHSSVESATANSDDLHVMQARLRVLENQNTELEMREQELHDQLASHRVALAELKGRSAELMNLINEQKSTESRYRQLFDLAPVAYLAVDENGYIEQVNLAATCLLRQPSVQLIDTPFSNFLGEGDHSHLNEHLSSVAETHLSLKWQVNLRLRNGLSQRVMLVSSCIRARQASRLKYQIMIVDITQQLNTEKLLRNANDYLEKLAHHDPLTNLPNRTMFTDRLQSLVAQRAMENGKVGIIYFDLDGFKPINDTLGHHIGDQVLCQVADRVRQYLGSNDTIARMGGDEFTIILSNPVNESAAVAVAQRIARVISMPMQLADSELSVTSSMGISLYPDHALRIDDLIKGADAAMYQAKQAGRDQVRLFSRESVDSFSRLSKLETCLPRAVLDEQLELHYQPIYNTVSLTVESIEALIRWDHPDLGIISPNEFIPLAEKSDRIVEIGRWVLETACWQANEWRKQGYAKPIAINVSTRQLLEPDFASQVQRALDFYQLPSQALEIEITESAIMIDHQRSRDTLRQLQNAGHIVTIDDFGTGHSSLARLVHLPVSRLKIDRMFIKDLDQSEQMRSVISSIITMAHRLDMRVVSEGVEQASQLEFLSANQCDAVQGFMMSRAELPSDISRLLKLDNEKISELCPDLPRLGLTRI